MAQIHHAQREVVVKVVYYGPSLGGKTTNIESVHNQSRPDRRGKLLSMNHSSERTLFLDFLPIELGTFKGYNVRLHLCSGPGQIAYEAARRLVLRHVDGVVFVVDSQRDRLEDNLNSLHNMNDNLRLHGVDPSRTPLVIQYNKRDLPNAMPLDELRRALGVVENVAQVQACARDGWGVFDTVKAVVVDCMSSIGDPRMRAEGRFDVRLRTPRASFRPTPPISQVQELKPRTRLPSWRWRVTGTDDK